MGEAGQIAMSAPPPREQDGSYALRREALRDYFDRTAADAWAALTSDAKVSRIRATVRAGRERMRALILSRLPDDLAGARVLDAGCGTGAMAAALAARGAAVTAVDLSPRMVEIARERSAALALAPGEAASEGRIAFASGDMLAAAHGAFDHVVAMDSLIHYELADVLSALGALAPRVSASIVFTHAPRTLLLAAMHTVGKAFPKSDRSPAIVPIAARRLATAVAREPALSGFALTATERVASGFYTSAMVELAKR